MNLSCLLSLLKDVPAYRQLVGELATVKGEHKAIILDAAKPYLIAALYEELNLPFLMVTGQPETARKLHEQLRAGVLLPPSCIVFLSSISCLMTVPSYPLSAIR